MLVCYAYLRSAPRPYGPAFAAFLEEGSATGDFETAQTKHLLSLDQEALRDAVIAFAGKGMKPVKGK